MGLSNSPRNFTKVMKPIFSHLRSTFGHICLSYIDDFLYIGNIAKECAEATLHAVQLLTRLGFNVNSAKSVLRPSQCAVNYITAMGGTRSAECNALASDIWQWANYAKYLVIRSPHPWGFQCCC